MKQVDEVHFFLNKQEWSELKLFFKGQKYKSVDEKADKAKWRKKKNRKKIKKMKKKINK